MKLLVALGLFAICCHARSIETNDYFLLDTQRNKFETFIESIKIILKNGNDTLGIPRMDPYNNERIPIDINVEDTINVNALLTKVDVRGLSEYNVNKADFVLIGFKILVRLSWPHVRANTNYTIKGSVGEFPIYGTGDMKFTAEDFDIDVEITFKIVGDHLQVKDITSKMHLKELKFVATGLYDDKEISEVLSALISDLVPQTINDNPELIQEYLHPIIEEKLNAFLNTMTIMDLIRMIS